MTVLKWMYENEGYRGYGTVSRAWRCPLCGDLYLGDDPPMECPCCLAPGASFQQIGGCQAVRRDRPRMAGAFSKPANRSLFDHYMRPEANQWIRSIRS